MGKYRVDVIYEDDVIVVINKPPGVLTIPDRHKPGLFNLQSFLTERYGRIWVVHRLDRETSGVLVFARQAGAHRDLSIQFEQRRVQKYYLALADGLPFPREGSIDKPIGPHPGQPGKMAVVRTGKPSLSRYRVLESFRQYSLLEVEIMTGRTHQIRVHLAAIGHPLAVDPLYGKREGFYLSEVKGQKYQLGKHAEERPLMSRNTLHAYKLSFDHPVSKKRMELEGTPPKDFRAVLKQLRKWGK